MNYRHSYHAGNIADVFKHYVLTLVLAGLQAKPSPFCAIDSHAGAGIYALDPGGEHEQGITSLWPERDAWSALARYFEYSGDAATVRELIPTAAGVLAGRSIGFLVRCWLEENAGSLPADERGPAAARAGFIRAQIEAARAEMAAHYKGLDDGLKIGVGARVSPS